MLTIHFSCGEPFGFKWGDGPWYDIRLTSYSTTAPNGGIPADDHGRWLDLQLRQQRHANRSDDRAELHRWLQWQRRKRRDERRDGKRAYGADR